jgi:hypothetical protein
LYSTGEVIPNPATEGQYEHSVDGDR